MRDHKSLLAWQEARAVALSVLRIGDKHWRPSLGSAFHQLYRASLSTQLNIADGYAFGPSPSFKRHLAIAYGSAVETTDLLEDLRDSELLPADLFTELILRSRRTQARLRGLLKQVGGG